jgi:hypothetical protein
LIGSGLALQRIPGAKARPAVFQRAVSRFIGPV